MRRNQRRRTAAAAERGFFLSSCAPEKELNDKERGNKLRRLLRFPFIRTIFDGRARAMLWIFVTLRPLGRRKMARPGRIY